MIKTPAPKEEQIIRKIRTKQIVQKKTVTEQTVIHQTICKVSQSQNKKSIRLQQGEKVKHKAFGVGHVVSIDGDKFIVEFNVGRKMFINPDVFDKGFMERM